MRDLVKSIFSILSASILPRPLRAVKPVVCPLAIGFPATNWRPAADAIRPFARISARDRPPRSTFSRRPGTTLDCSVSNCTIQYGKAGEA